MRLAVLLAIAGAAVALVAVAAFFVLSPSGPAPARARRVVSGEGGVFSLRMREGEASGAS